MKTRLVIFSIMICIIGMCFVFMGCEEIFNSPIFQGDGSNDSPIYMSENKWYDGKLVDTNSGGTGEQWFSFIATASTQYIYVKFSTLTNLNAYLYDEDDNIIGTYEHMYGDSGIVNNFSRLVKKGKRYYIKITQGDYKYNYSNTGSYWIGFNDFPARPEKSIIDLTISEWENSSINPAAGGDSYDWYSFVATTGEQYIHVKFSTMTNVYVYVYDKDLNLVGTYEHLFGESGESKSFSRLVSKGDKYYVKLAQGPDKYNYSNTGSYWIAFNENDVTP